jgi:glutamyl-tRNA synthetase
VQDMIEHFTWERVSLGGSVFDLDKLAWMNGKYVREVLDLDDLTRRCIPFLQAASLDTSNYEQAKQVVHVLRERFRLLSELPPMAAYFFSDDYQTDEKAARKIEEGRDTLTALLPRLADAPAWDEVTLDPIVRAVADERSAKLGQVMQPLRAALTGRLESPGMYEVLGTLGRERSLARVRRAVEGT